MVLRDREDSCTQESDMDFIFEISYLCQQYGYKEGRGRVVNQDVEGNFRSVGKLRFAGQLGLFSL